MNGGIVFFASFGILNMWMVHMLLDNQQFPTPQTPIKGKKIANAKSRRTFTVSRCHATQDYAFKKTSATVNNAQEIAIVHLLHNI